jgi:hypothetical protein
MSTGSIISTHRLDNGLELTFLNQSRQIAADRWYVCITVQVRIPVEKKWFTHHPVDDLDFQQMRRELGDTVLFEQKKDRNFVSADQKNKIIEEICDGTLKTTEHYLGLATFAARFILKQYAEKMRQL